MLKVLKYTYHENNNTVKVLCMTIAKLSTREENICIYSIMKCRRTHVKAIHEILENTSKMQVKDKCFHNITSSVIISKCGRKGKEPINGIKLNKNEFPSVTLDCSTFRIRYLVRKIIGIKHGLALWLPTHDRNKS